MDSSEALPPGRLPCSRYPSRSVIVAMIAVCWTGSLINRPVLGMRVVDDQRDPDAFLVDGVVVLAHPVLDWQIAMVPR